MVPAGETFLVYFGGEAFPAQLTADFSSSRENRTTSNKQSGDFEESKPQRISSTMSLNALLDDNATLSPVDIWNHYKDGDIEATKLSQEVVGGLEIVGTAYISNVGITAPDQDNTELPIELTFTGEHDIVEITV